MARITHFVVARGTGEIISRHTSLNAARAAWRAKAYPGGDTKRPLTRWASLHHIKPMARAPQEDAA